MAEMVQGSAAWLAARVGKATASRIADVVGRTAKGAWRAERRKYFRELVAERLTGEAVHHFTSVEMMWGIEQEPRARLAYELVTGRDTIKVGFIQHPRFTDAGASPDGLVEADGLVEFKCPRTETHVDTLLADAVPEDHLPQVQWQMACTGRAWCDFVSFDPRLPEHLSLFIRRVPRDDAYIAELERDVGEFLLEVAQTVSRLDALGHREAA